MHIRYPVRSFKCPFCGARMLPEEYKGWKPWKCHGYSAELQVSAAYGQTVQLVVFATVLLVLYLTGFRGWQLFVAAIFLAFVLTALLVGPLGRVLPPRLERYRPAAWRQDRFVTLSPRGVVDPEKPDGEGQSGHEQPSDPHSANTRKKKSSSLGVGGRLCLRKRGRHEVVVFSQREGIRGCPGNTKAPIVSRGFSEFI